MIPWRQDPGQSAVTGPFSFPPLYHDRHCRQHNHWEYYLCGEDGLREEIVAVLFPVVDCLLLDDHRLDPLSLHLLYTLDNILHDLLEHENQTSVRKSDIRTGGNEQIGESIGGERVVGDRLLAPFVVDIDTITSDEGDVFVASRIETGGTDNGVDIADLSVDRLDSV